MEKKFKRIIFCCIAMVMVVLLITIIREPDTDLLKRDGSLDVIDDNVEETRRQMEFVETMDTDVYGDKIETDSIFKFAKFVYDVDSDIENEKKEFLGENYDLYKPVLDKIRVECSAIMRNIPEGREGYNPLESKSIGIAYTDGCMLSTGMEGYDSFFIENALTAIDFFDETCVVYAYNYPENKYNELVVVDYKNILVNTDYSTKVMSIGDIRSVSGYKENSIIRKINDFYILFLKG